MVNLVFFKHSHESVGIGKCAFSYHSTPYDLQIVFTVKIKLFKVRINFKKVIITLDGLFLRFNVVSTAFMLSLRGILVKSERTSIVTKMLFSGILLRLFF